MIVVVLVSPLFAMALVWTTKKRIGLILSSLSMFGSFLFGLYHHFLEMNAQVSSNRLRDEQSVRREDKGDSPFTRGLQTNLIGAGNQSSLRCVL